MHEQRLMDAGGMPEWYALCDEAKALDTNPWELFAAGPYWRSVARAYREVQQKLDELRR